MAARVTVKRVAKTFLSAIAFLCSAAIAHSASNDPVGDFFKRLGNSIAHPGAPKPHPKNQKRATSKKTIPAKGSQTTQTPTPAGETAPAMIETREVAPAEPIASTTPLPLPIRAAGSAPETRGRRRDIPYGLPVPNRAGFVTSPYAPNQGLVDVRAFPSGTEVKDPFTGKVFLTP